MVDNNSMLGVDVMYCLLLIINEPKTDVYTSLSWRSPDCYVLSFMPKGGFYNFNDENVPHQIWEEQENLSFYFF